MAQLTIVSTRQIGQFGLGVFVYEFVASDGTKHVFYCYKNNGNAYYKPSSVLSAIANIATSVVAMYSSSYPTDGFVGQDTSTPTAVSIPIPVGLTIQELFTESNYPGSGVAIVPTFVPALGFTTPASTTSTVKNLPVVLSAANGVQDYPLMTPTRSANFVDDIVQTVKDNPILAVGVVLLLVELYRMATRKGKGKNYKILGLF